MADNKEALPLPSLGWLVKHNYLGPHTVWCGHNSVGDYRDADQGAHSTELTSMPAATAALSELRAEVERYKADTERLDWLCKQYVTVRIPMRYGSRMCFLGSPEDGDGETFPWDIRAAIDTARSAASGESAEGGK